MNYSEHLAKTGPFPVDLSIDFAEGSYIYDRNGKAYLDFISGIGVSYVGHQNTEVKNALKRQIDKHLHVMVYGEFDYSPQRAYAEKLIDVTLNSFDQVYFTNSGTEANEAALKLAKRTTGRSEIISFERSYHGSTHGSLSVSGNEYRKTNFRPLLPGVRFLKFNSSTDLDEISTKTAAVIIEPIQGDAGVVIPDFEFIQNLRRKCSENGVLLIFDEIQTGFGRTGKLFSYMHYGVVPDLLTLGKSLGGGLPLGALLGKRGLLEKFTFNPPLGHITTFGGNPLSCTAGLSSLDFALKNRLIDEVESKGAWIENHLKNPKIKEIRRKGLFIAVELISPEEVEFMVQESLKEGLIIYWFLSTKNCFRIAPPLTVSYKELEEACFILQKNLNKL